jgi:hypothetical protein
MGVADGRKEDMDRARNAARLQMQEASISIGRI